MSENYWSVTVSLNGEPVVTIEPGMLSGKDIGDPELEAIRESAMNLLAFAGISVTENEKPEPDMSWLPDDLALNGETGTQNDTSAKTHDNRLHNDCDVGACCACAEDEKNA